MCRIRFMNIFRWARRSRISAQHTELAELAAEALGGSGHSGDSPASMMRLASIDRQGRTLVAVTELPGNLTSVFVPTAGATVHHIDRRPRQNQSQRPGQGQGQGRRSQPVRPPATAAGAPAATKLNLPAPPRAALAWLDKSA